MISKTGSAFFCSLLLATLSACQTSRAVSEPGLGLSESVSYCWEVPAGDPHWQPTKVALGGNPPFTDREVENLLAQLSTGGLKTAQVMRTIDERTVVRLDYLVMDSGDFFSYALSENYQLTYRYLIRGGDVDSGYCICPKHQSDGLCCGDSSWPK